jgi:hypothetical protein
VHADVLEADFTLHGGKLLLPVRTQALIGAARPNHSEGDTCVRSNDVSDIGPHRAGLGEDG